MPKVPAKPLFVPPGAVPGEEGWRIAHRASDEYQRSVELAVRKATKDFRAKSMGDFEGALSRGSTSAVASLNWTSYEDDLAEMLESRFQGIAKQVEKRFRRGLPAAYQYDQASALKVIRKRARSEARAIVQASRRSAVQATSRLRSAGFSEREIAMRLREMLGLTKLQASALLNRQLGMAAAGASTTTVLSDTKRRAIAKLWSRSTTVARTSNLSIATLLQRLIVTQAVEQGVVEDNAGKQWVAALDVTHVNCARLDGQTVPVDEPFVDPVSGRELMEPPLHQNCRCGVHYVTTEIPLQRGDTVSEQVISFPFDLGKAITDRVARETLEFHLPGKHDQRSHGRKGRGSRVSDSANVYGPGAYAPTFGALPEVGRFGPGSTVKGDLAKLEKAREDLAFLGVTQDAVDQRFNDMLKGVPDDEVKKAGNWYKDEMDKEVKRLAKEHGITEDQAAAGLAALSPQNEFSDTWKGRDDPIRCNQYAMEYLTKDFADGKKYEVDQAALDNMVKRDKKGNVKLDKDGQPIPLPVQAEAAKLLGKGPLTLKDMPSDVGAELHRGPGIDKGKWVEGKEVSVHMKKPMESAIDMLKGSDPSELSGWKVRSFYQNGRAGSDSDTAVTINGHMASVMMKKTALGKNDPERDVFFGGSGPASAAHYVAAQEMIQSYHDRISGPKYGFDSPKQTQAAIWVERRKKLSSAEWSKEYFDTVESKKITKRVVARKAAAKKARADAKAAKDAKKAKKDLDVAASEFAEPEYKTEAYKEFETYVIDLMMSRYADFARGKPLEGYDELLGPWTLADQRHYESIRERAASEAESVTTARRTLLSFHLPGKHDQRSHGRKGKGKGRTGIERAYDGISADIRGQLKEKEIEISKLTDHEEAFAINAETGKVVLDKRGDKSSVDLKDDIANMSDAIFTHNHPSGNGFSDADIMVGFNGEVKEMRAVTGSAVYRAKYPKPPEFDSLEQKKQWLADKSDTYRAVESYQRMQWGPEIASGKRTMESANKEHHHEVMVKAAALLGIEYERVSP